MFGFSDKHLAFFKSEKISEFASQLALELGKTCGVGLLPTVAMSAGALVILNKKPAIMRFVNRAWSPEGEGSPLNRRDSVMCIATPSSSSCVVGVKNDFVESPTTTPSSSCVDGVKSRKIDLDPTPSTHLLKRVALNQGVTTINMIKRLETEIQSPRRSESVSFVGVHRHS